MGLDSYLIESEYLSEYYNPERHKAVCKALGRDDVNGIEYEVGYWRKANHIHHWFVENVQEGVDECQKSYVSHEQLQELYDVCKEVMEVVQTVDSEEEMTDIVDGKATLVKVKTREVVNSSTIHKLLPTTSGFFFGDTSYDEWYLADVERTIEILDNLRNEDGKIGRKGMDYYYRASW